MRFTGNIRTGRVAALYNSIHDKSVKREDRPDYLHTQEVDQLELDFGGIIGNRHYGLTRMADGRTKQMYEKGSVEIRNNAQWVAVSEEEIVRINQNLELGEDELKPTFIGSNILVHGIKDFTRIPRGYYMVFTHAQIYRPNLEDQVVLIIHGEVNPCTIAGKGVESGVNRDNLAARFPKAANHLRGLRGWVEKPGSIEPGMFIHVLEPTGRT